MSRDAGDLASVIRLHAPDGDEGVAPLCQCVRYEVLELARLVAAESDPELQSSRLAQISTLPPRWALSRGSGWMGDGPNVRG
jgi:hypothetical protein